MPIRTTRCPVCKGRKKVPDTDNAQYDENTQKLVVGFKVCPNCKGTGVSEIRDVDLGVSSYDDDPED
jgi:RecJ-like exonuclease